MDDMMYDRYKDYLHFIWKMQEIEGNLPKEFEGME